MNWLRELRDEPVDQAVLDGIRRRALAQIAAAPPRRGLRWWWFLPPAAAAAVAGAMLLGMVRAPEPPRPMAFTPPPMPALPSPRPVPRRAAPVRAHAAATEPLLMKIVTDDPDVVIYWIVEGTQKGD